MKFKKYTYYETKIKSYFSVSKLSYDIISPHGTSFYIILNIIKETVLVAKLN